MATSMLSPIWGFTGIRLAEKAVNQLDQKFLPRPTEIFRCIPIRNMSQNRKFNDYGPPQALTGQIDPSLGTTTETEKIGKVSTYLFRTEDGGQVKVLVGIKNAKHIVRIESSSLPQVTDNLILNWGIFRSDSSYLTVPESHKSSGSISEHSKSENRTIPLLTPFVNESSIGNVLQLEFEPNETPFFLSFLLCSKHSNVTGESYTRTHMGTNFCVPVGIGSGYPFPLGVTFSNDGSVNFSLFSNNAATVVLCLYDEYSHDKPSLDIELDPYINRTGSIWHISLENVGQYVSYGYRFNRESLQEKQNENPVCLDPYAKVLRSFIYEKENSVSHLSLGSLCKEPCFDWGDDIHPCLPMEKLMVYRLNVKNFTNHKSSQVSHDLMGTFSGVIEKLDHLKKLGINAILLEPIFHFNEKKGPYIPYHFFSPESSYGRSPDGVFAITSMKEMVKALHASSIEVLLEVAFACPEKEGEESSQMEKPGEIGKNSFNIINGGNSYNCNDPNIQQIILDILHHWVTEYHIDGFSFIDASFLVQDSNGKTLSRPPLIEAISFDHILSKTKIIADFWSPIDLRNKEIRFPHWRRWAEMNSRFSYDIKNFVRGKGLLSDLATRLCGSGDIFSDGRGPAFTFNYIARNFGLPLVDLVSFSDGSLSSTQLSWNCGEEGPTSKASVLNLRLRQIRNFLFILYISLGVPVLNMGDECGHSTGGSPSYSKRRSFNWDMLKTGFGTETSQFISFLTTLRMRRSDLLQVKKFVKEENILWQGNDENGPKWEDPSCKFLTVTLRTDQDDVNSNSKRANLYITFNASDSSESVVLPTLPQGETWQRLVDTSLSFPGFFLMDNGLTFVQDGGTTYEIKAYSCVLFEAQDA